MSRSRIIKGDMFRSRSLAKCSRDARLTFIGLWTECDDAGRGVADADILCGLLWPLDKDIDSDCVESHLQELAATDHIRLYEADGERFFYIVKWEKHQAAAYRKGVPKHPDPADLSVSTILHASACKNSPEGKGKEGKGTFAPIPKTAPRPRPVVAAAPRGAIWTALSDRFGEPTTGQEKSNRGRQVKELTEAGASSDDIVARCNEHAARRIQWTLTANALVTHWTELEPKKSPAHLLNGVRMSREAMARQ